jgi:hypothetical protein
MPNRRRNLRNFLGRKGDTEINEGQIEAYADRIGHFASFIVNANHGVM